MQSPGDELNERLRKNREEARQRMGPRKKPSPKEPFVPYKTMIKLEGWPRVNSLNKEPRGVVCESCGQIIPFTIYTIAPEKFDQECGQCGMTADEFWKGKLHRELDVDA